MRQFCEELYKTISIIFDKKASKLKYNYIVDGKIKSILGNNIYAVQIDEIDYEIKSMYDIISYQIGDIVQVEIFNNDFSNKKIKCKR